MEKTFSCSFKKESILKAISESTELSSKVLTGKASELNSSLEIGESSEPFAIAITNIKGKKTFASSQKRELDGLPLWAEPSKTHSLHFFYLQKDSDTENRSAIRFINLEDKTNVVENLFAKKPINEINVKLVCSQFETKEGKLVRAVTVEYVPE